MATIRLFQFFRRWRNPLFAAAGVLFIVLGTLVALRWARGDRPTFGKRGAAITGTGLLVSSSDPKGAQVFLNGKLTTATDDTLNLPPGNYDVEIKKDGFTPWRKTLAIVAELVTQTNAKLFPSAPTLTPLTFSGASESVPSPDGQKIVYKVNSASTDAKNGLWVLELADRNLPIARASEPKQIARNISNYNFLDAHLTWTPDSNQVLVYWTEDATIKAAVLLSANSLNNPETIRDVSSRLPVLLSQWHSDLDLKDQEKLTKLPEFMNQVATPSAFAYFSPDELRLLYRPSKELTIPDNLASNLPSESTQKEERDIKVDGLYVYDIKEDKNFRVGDAEKSEEKVSQVARVPRVSQEKKINTSRARGTRGTSDTRDTSDTRGTSHEYWSDRLAGVPSAAATLTKATVTLPPIPSELMIQFLTLLRDRYSPIWKEEVQWFPTSAHLLKRGEQRISILEHDGANNITIYDGPFAESFVYPWPNGSRLVILTKLNDSSPANLYAIGLK